MVVLNSLCYNVHATFTEVTDIQCQAQTSLKYHILASIKDIGFSYCHNKQRQ